MKQVFNTIDTTILSCVTSLLISVVVCSGQAAEGTVVAWGSDVYGETNVPSGLTNVVAIAVGALHSLALRDDGTVVGWGYNVHGEALPPAGLSNVIAISAGYYHSLALKNDGTVVGWGDDSGEITIPPDLTNAIAIAAGGWNGNEDFSLALKSDGTVVGWGGWAFGGAQNIPAGLSNVVAIAAGQTDGMALKSDGTVAAWDYLINGYGKATVPLGLSNVVAIAAASAHSLALKADGTIVAWGGNGSGQTNVPITLSNVVAIAAGSFSDWDSTGYSMALKSDGTILSWGCCLTNPPGYNNVVAISGKWYHAMALISTNLPAIIRQPWSQCVYGGFSATFSVGAVGGSWPLSYQWQFGGTSIIGATNSILLVTNVQPSNAGNYAVLVSNTMGIAESSYVVLTVMTNPPTITLQPTNQSVPSGTNVTFTIQTGVGPIPITYQWQFNGTNINGATDASLTLINVQVAQQGNYGVVVSNPFGSTTSSNATLSVIVFPPSITAQPTNKLVLLGSNVTLAVTATGTVPLSYQWQFNGNELLGATNNSMTIQNAQLTNQGVYNVVVSNRADIQISSNAVLTVVDLTASLGATNLVWVTSGSSPWFPETNITHNGIAAAQSGSAGSGQQSILQTTVTGPGTLNFWWRISSLGSLSFAINGISQSAINFVSGWQLKTVYLGSGSQTLSWTYTGGSSSFGANAAWLAQVSFIPGGTAPILTVIPTNQTAFTGATVTFNAAAVGTPPLIYQWVFNGQNASNATLAVLSLTNVQTSASGSYAIIVTNDYGAISTNAILMVQPFVLGSGQTSLQMSSNGFQVQIGGVFAKNSLVIYASTNLINWLPVFTNPPVTGSVLFLDTNVVSMPLQFYRAAEQ